MKQIVHPHYITFLAPKKPKTIPKIFSWLTSFLTSFLYLIKTGNFFVPGCHMGIISDYIKMIHASFFVKEEDYDDVAKRNGYSGYRLWVCNVSGYNHIEAVKHAKTQIGKLYDFKKLWYAIKFIFLKLIGKTPKQKLDDEGFVMCQELAQESAIKGGCPFNKDWLYPLDFETSGYFNLVKEVRL